MSVRLYVTMKIKVVLHIKRTKKTAYGSRGFCKLKTIISSLYPNLTINVISQFF